MNASQIAALLPSMSDAELVTLNRQVIAVLNARVAQKRAVEKAAFAKGDEVFYRNRVGQRVDGVVFGFTGARVKVGPKGAPTFNCYVPASMLTKVA